MLGSYDCGRIINPKTAISQFRGGIIMGIGLALMEDTEFDERTGRIMNPSLAEYHVPVHMDVPRIDVMWTDIPDPHTPAGARGIGEIGITGVAAASPTRSTTRPAAAYATCRSRWTSSSDGARIAVSCELRASGTLVEALPGGRADVDETANCRAVIVVVGRQDCVVDTCGSGDRQVSGSPTCLASGRGDDGLQVPPFARDAIIDGQRLREPRLDHPQPSRSSCAGVLIMRDEQSEMQCGD